MQLDACRNVDRRVIFVGSELFLKRVTDTGRVTTRGRLAQTSIQATETSRRRQGYIVLNRSLYAHYGHARGDVILFRRAIFSGLAFGRFETVCVTWSK